MDRLDTLGPRQFQMRRNALLSVMALRVLCCPFLCMGTENDANAAFKQHNHAHRCQCESTISHCSLAPTNDASHGEDGPCPAHCPCDESCVCHALLDAPNKTRQLGYDWHVNRYFDTLFDEAATTSLVGTNRLQYRAEARPDLHLGKMIRLIIASLLL